MKTSVSMFAGLLIAVAMVPGTTWAQGKGNAKAPVKQDDQSVGDKVREVMPASQPVFATREITLIQSYFRTNLSSLPPGLQKQLERNGTLPPGLQKKIQPLPLDLERQLSVIPTGYRRVVVAGNVILMNPTTGLIYDIVRNVIP